MTSELPTYSRRQIWLLAIRPKTLWAAVAPVIVGAAIAVDDNFIHIGSFLAALLGAVFIQIGTNLANDYFDFKKATDTPDRVGPLRVTQAGLVTPGQMRNATAIAFAIAFLIGIYLVYRGGWPIVAVGLSSILFGVLYTGGPFPLGYNGLGDLCVFIFFGPVAVGGTYYVMAQSITTSAILAGISPGLLSMAILVVNNIRDIRTDSAAGKRTLAVRLGRRFSEIQYLVIVVAALLYPLVFFVLTGKHAPAIMAAAALIPAIPLIRSVFKHDGTSLNDTLAGTGKLLAIYAILFAIGWLV